MEYKVILSSEAEIELENIYKYLAIEKMDGINAGKITSEITKRILSLGIFPEACARYERNPNYRVAHVKRYKIFYRVDKKHKSVVVVHIMHSLQDF